MSRLKSKIPIRRGRDPQSLLTKSRRFRLIRMLQHSRITDHESRTTDVRSALRDAIAQLEREHVPSAALAAELLLMHILDRDRAWIYAHPEQELDAPARERYFSLVTRRAGGVPTQYLTGHQEFWGLDFEVTPAVLIPRPETEHVIEVALERLGITAATAAQRRSDALRIADVGTGSGCIAVALAHELPGARVVATDISAAALEVARRNAARHEVSDRVDFTECNLLEAFFHQSPFTPVQDRPATLPPPMADSGQASHPSSPSGRLRARESRLFDLIASNPPYIGRNEAAALPREVREHEPEEALFGGEAGTEIYAPLIAQAAMLLKPNGILVLELGHNSREHASRLLAAAEWTGVAVTHDLAGIPRVASALRSSR